MIPSHIQKIKSFLAMDILEELERRRRLGEPVISFSLGEPDLPPPSEVRDACRAALDSDFIKYTSSLGLLELRESIASHYRKKYGVTVDPDQIIVTGGTSPAMLLVFSVLLSQGDEVILSNPHYPCYPAFLEYLRAKSVFVKVREEDGFQYRSDDIRRKISPKTKAIFLNSPSNPTGHLLSDDVMKAVAGFASKKRWIVSDEIYHGLVYKGERERSILEFTDRAFVINGFSKAYAMTGYRLGYLIAPKPFLRTLQILHQNFFISANSFVQKAGIAALEVGDAYLARVRKIYDERRQRMLDGIRKLGFTVAVEPRGAFYIFANAKLFTKNSYRFAFDLLKKTGVGVTPGIDFGSAGEGYLRFSYATSIENIDEGLARIAKVI